MKVLHVSDWHLGRVTYSEPRAGDHDAVLAEIIALARRERPELICHTGDLFDQPRPSYSDMARGITALQELAVVAPVVVVCGNHDSPRLFEVFAQLLGPDSRIHFVAEPRLPDGGGILRFDAADGTILRLGVLPFVHANRSVNAFEDPHTWRGAYTDRLGRMEQKIAAGLLDDLDERREVAMFAAHLHIGGAVLSGTERHTTEYYSTSADHLPAVSYAAFGHIHKPQALPSTRITGRYAGSPIQLDFGEEGENKSVALVDLRPGRPAHVETIGLTGGRRLRRFEGTLDALRKLAPTIGNELCLLTIRSPTHDPTLSDQVADLLPEAVVVQLTEVCADRRLEILTEESVAGDVEPDVRQLFREYLTEQGTRGAAADRVLDMFTTLLATVADENLPVLPEESLLSAPIDPGITGTAPREPAS